MGGGSSMPRFFIEGCSASKGGKITLGGDDAKHISLSLRSKIGEGFTICDGSGTDFSCVISSIDRDRVIFDVLDVLRCPAEPKVKVTLYQALTKSDKFDTIVQKAVELGVFSVVPVLSERCISRPDEKQSEKKVERWNRISREAAMQSGRGIIPKVENVTEYKNALEEMQKADFSFICYEAEPHTALEELLRENNVTLDTESISFFVGPEGGIDISEVEKAKDMGICASSLGKRILRTETAPLCVLSALMFATGNLG